MSALRRDVNVCSPPVEDLRTFAPGSAGSRLCALCERSGRDCLFDVRHIGLGRKQIRGRPAPDLRPSPRPFRDRALARRHQGPAAGRLRMLVDLTGPLSAPADNPKPSDIMPEASWPANAGLRVLGLDVSKDTIALHDSVTGRHATIANTGPALRQALMAYADYDWAVCETTGGYERGVLQACFALGLPACRADAAQVKAFIASHGGRAKTDLIDAAWLTRYGLERADKLKPWSPPAPEREAFAELVRHRQDLLSQRTQAKNRRSAPAGYAIHDLLDEQIAFLSQQIGRIDTQLASLIKACPQLARDETALRSIPGVGPVAARTLLALLPELGRVGPKQAASLAGLAPHPRDSGLSRPRRHMRGGRAGLRPILFMAALAATRAHPSLQEFYKRLVTVGKPKRLAIAALARKLVVIANAVLRDARSASNQLT